MATPKRPPPPPECGICERPMYDGTPVFRAVGRTHDGEERTFDFCSGGCRTLFLSGVRALLAIDDDRDLLEEPMPAWQRHRLVAA
jgi:hypothetical protein